MTTPATLVEGQALPAYSVRAHNAATASENKIHDDDVTKQYGFAGGLVPGVTVYAYMTRPVVDAFGIDWLERGTMSARFLKPFYEGQEVQVLGTVTSTAGEGISIDLQALNEAGEVCAIGSAGLPRTAGPAPDAAAYPIAPLPAARPPVSREVLAATPVLGTINDSFDAREKFPKFIEEIRDNHPLYRGDDAVAHSGLLIRYANQALALNVQLNPWIHVSSDVTHFGLARHGDRLSTRSRVIDLFERKGHSFVDLDVLVVANDTRPLMHVHHTAIYDVRKVADDGR